MGNSVIRRFPIETNLAFKSDKSHGDVRSGNGFPLLPTDSLLSLQTELGLDCEGKVKESSAIHKCTGPKRLQADKDVGKTANQGRDTCAFLSMPFGGIFVLSV